MSTTTNLRWYGQSIRIEHIVAPGGWFTPRVNHLAHCLCRCCEAQTCPVCCEVSWPASIAGRWDTEGGHTARPFDPVWVRLSCGCEFGDHALSQPPAPTEARQSAGVANACACGDCYHPVVGPNTDGEPCDWCRDCGCPSADHTRMTEVTR